MGQALELGSASLGMAGRDDAAALLGLVNMIQPHVPWSEEHLAWQYFDSPAGPARLYVIRDAGRIVSLYSAVQQRVKAETVQKGWMVQDVMTDPAYRGRGFLHHLGQLCLQDIRDEGAVGYTFPNKLSEGSFRRNGWDALGAVPLRVATTDAIDAGPGADPSLVQAIDAFGPVHERAWLDSQLGVGVHRDAAFLTWRYAKPGRTYHRFDLGSGAGYLVLKVHEGDDTKTVHICDLVTHAGARDLVPHALAFTREYAHAVSAQTITAWLPPDHPFARSFDLAGLTIRAGYDRVVFVTAYSNSPWHLTQGDSDVY